jgi:hypothetical protein
MILSRLLGPCLVALALAISPTLSASAADEQAKQFLERIYRPYIGSNGHGLDYQSAAKSRLYFDTELNALYRKDQKESAGEVGRLDFDPFVQAQDFAIDSVRVTIVSEQAGRAKAMAAFTNAGQPVTVEYDLVQTSGGWRIANIIWPKWKNDLKSLLSKPFP